MQLGHPGRHDPRVMTGGVSEGKLTKRRKSYKYESKEEALEARRKRRNRAQKERRHRARKHELATSGEKTPHRVMRGGGQKKKRRVRQKRTKSIQHTKQRRQWRWAENSRIWQALHATWQKREFAKNSAMQAAINEEKSRVSSRWRRMVERSNS